MPVKKMITEYGGKEKYASKAAQKKHESKESKTKEANEQKKFGSKKR